MKLIRMWYLVGFMLSPIVLMNVIHVDAVPRSGWEIAQIIESDNAGNANYPQVVTDQAGNAFAVWCQSDGIRYNIYSNRYTAGFGWGPATLIEFDNAGRVYNPQVATDQAGNAIAVWSQSDGTRNNIWSNRYTEGVGWTTPTLIETDDSGDARDPQVAFDPSGNATVVWYQSDGTRDNIWSNRYTTGVGWDTAKLIESNNAGNADIPQVVVDLSGNAIAVWEQMDGTAYSIWSNRYKAGVGWGTATLIETDNTGGASLPQVAMDPSGNAIAVWCQSDGAQENIWSNRYTAGVGWATAQRIETVAGNPWNPQVAVDPSGNAIAVWRRFDDPWYSIWSNRYTTGVGWATAQRIESNNVGDAYDPQIAVDPLGNAIAVWCEWKWEIPRCNIWSNRFTAGVGWATAHLIETDNAGDAFNPQVAVDPSGNMITMWEQWDGTRWNIWSNRYVKPDTIPPALSLSSPVDGSNTDTSVVMVSGTSEPGSVLSINGLTVSVRANGSFSCAIDLFDGPNTIDAIAMDEWGNRAEIQITVTYNDPLPSLISDMISMEDRIASIEGSLENLSVDLADALSKLATLEASMNGTKADIDTISKGLATIDVNLQTYKDDLTRLQGLIDTVVSDLNEIIANITDLKETLKGIGDELVMTQGEVDDLQRSLNATNTKLNSLDHELNLTENELSSVQSDQSIIKDDQEYNNKVIDSLKDDLDAMKTLNIILLIGLGFTLILLFILFILVIVTRRKVSNREINTGLPDNIRNGT